MKHKDDIIAKVEKLGKIAAKAADASHRKVLPYMTCVNFSRRKIMNTMIFGIRLRSVRDVSTSLPMRFQLCKQRLMYRLNLSVCPKMRTAEIR